MTAVVNFFKPAPEMREQSFLQELERNPTVSQRELSRKFGIALGVTNACLKGMERKGWIQRRSLDHNRNGYFLTPKGVAEKIRLTSDLVAWRIQHYATLKEMLGKLFLELEHRGIKRVVFYGVSAEMEVAYLTLQGGKLNLAGIVEDDEKVGSQIILGYELEPVSRVKELKPDCILITSLAESDSRKERLRKLLDVEGICIEDICFS